MNPLFQQMNNSGAGVPGNVQNIVKQFQQFKQNFSGDPRQQVQQMLNSGKITQEQYNRAVQMANSLQNILK